MSIYSPVSQKSWWLLGLPCRCSIGKDWVHVPTSAHILLQDGFYGRELVHHQLIHSSLMRHHMLVQHNSDHQCRLILTFVLMHWLRIKTIQIAKSKETLVTFPSDVTYLTHTASCSVCLSLASSTITAYIFEALISLMRFSVTSWEQHSIISFCEECDK